MVCFYRVEKILISNNFQVGWISKSSNHNFSAAALAQIWCFIADEAYCDQLTRAHGCMQTEFYILWRER